MSFDMCDDVAEELPSQVRRDHLGIVVDLDSLAGRDYHSQDGRLTAADSLHDHGGCHGQCKQGGIETDV